MITNNSTPASRDTSKPPMRLRFMGMLVILLVAALGVVSAGAASASQRRETYLGANADGSHPAIRPRHRWLSGDGTVYVDRLRWNSWGGRVARARGRGAVNDCVPGCAQGHMHRGGVHLAAYRIRRKCGRRWYTRVRVTWVGASPLGGGRSFVMLADPLLCQ